MSLTNGSIEEQNTKFEGKKEGVEKRDDQVSISSIDELNFDSGEINELAVVAEGEEKTTWFVWILVLCSTISGLLFGMYRAINFMPSTKKST